MLARIDSFYVKSSMLIDRESNIGFTADKWYINVIAADGTAVTQQKTLVDPKDIEDVLVSTNFVDTVIKANSISLMLFLGNDEITANVEVKTETQTEQERPLMRYIKELIRDEA